MAEERTKADKLQRSIERAGKRIGARSGEPASEAIQDTEPLISVLGPARLEPTIRRPARPQSEARGVGDGHDLDEAAS